MSTWRLGNGATVRVLQGDIAAWEGDVVVTAANEALAGGGGVDGAIHRAAGPELLRACLALPAIGGVRCPTGEARVTPGFRLKARWVVHAVGPIYTRSADADGELAAAFTSSLEAAKQAGGRSIGLPAISCGVYGFPVDRAAEIAMRVADEAGGGLDWIDLVLFDRGTLNVWTRAARARWGEPGG